MQVTSRVPLHNKNKRINQIISANMKKKKKHKFSRQQQSIKKGQKIYQNP